MRTAGWLVLALLGVLLTSCSRPIVRMTLNMDWKRGDQRYGPQFIRLSAPCQTPSSSNCLCVADFKHINSKRFAEYIETFGPGKVPVTFDVLKRFDGRLGARVANVGNWSGDRFPRHDGQLRIIIHLPPVSQKSDTRIRRTAFIAAVSGAKPSSLMTRGGQHAP